MCLMQTPLWEFKWVYVAMFYYKIVKERLLGHWVLIIYGQFCSKLIVALEIFLDNDLLSIEDQRLLFVQPESHKYA